MMFHQQTKINFSLTAAQSPSPYAIDNVRFYRLLSFPFVKYIFEVKRLAATHCTMDCLSIGHNAGDHNIGFSNYTFLIIFMVCYVFFFVFCLYL